jgi:alanyl-tRNA synthetase
MEEHQDLSKMGAGQKFKGGLADHQERTIMGHTATHLMHQALRDMFGKKLHQTGSNITTERVRFDFNFERKLSDEEIKQLENTVKEKIKENLPVHFEMIPTEEAKKMGAIGLFDDTYQDTSKIYFIGPTEHSGQVSHEHEKAYSIEFCGGPHVDFTSKLKSFKIIKQEALGQGQRRVYAKIG